MKTSALALILLAFVCRLLAGEAADARLGAYRASIAQEFVQTDAGKTKAALAALITEAKLNGIGDENAATLNAFLAQLGTLTEDDMKKVINDLKTASATTKDASRQSQILAASESQQGIANRLFALANNIAANHAKQSLPHDLRDLIGRQLANIRLTLRQQAPGMKPEPADIAHIAGNQKAIAGLTTTVLETMKQLVATLPASEAEPIKVALDSFTTAKLSAVADQAAGAAADKNLPASGRLQARVRDILLAGTQAMADKQTLADKLVGLSETLERLITEQIALNEETRIEPPPDVPALASRQTGLSDETGILRTTTPGISKENIATLEQARLAMQAASGTLTKGDTGAATRDKQDEALAALRKGREQVLTQLKTEMERLEKTAKALADAQAQVAEAQQALGKSESAAAAAAAQSLAAAAASTAAAAAEGGLPPPAGEATAAAQADIAAAQTAQAADNAAAAQQAASSAATNLAAAAAAVAQAQASMSNQAASAAANAEAQAAEAAAAAAAAANATVAAMQDGAATSESQAAAATSAADAADGAAAAATRGDAKAGFQKAAGAFREAAAAAKAGKPPLAVAEAVKGSGIVADAMNAIMFSNASAAPGSAPPSGDPAASLGANSRSAGMQVLGLLRPRDREAIEQARMEKTPPEFTPLVRQYFKNLADEPTP